MTSSESRHFPSACRRFLSRLTDFVESDEQPPEHARECARCAASLQSAVRQIEVLRALAPPSIPAEISRPEVLDGIYERASEMSEAVVGATLQSELGPLAAPTDAVWQEVSDRSDLASSLQSGLAEPRTPGWMWKRIRASIDEAGSKAEPVPVRMWARVGLAAAALVAISLLIFDNPFRPDDQGTPPLLSVVFEVQSKPFDSAFSLNGFLEVGR